MVFEVLAISAAFTFGLLARQIGLPPLVGFLAAGFALNATGTTTGLDPASVDILNYLAHLGVLMLLFTVGLKLKIGQIGTPHVIGGAGVHFVISVVLVAPLLWLFFSRGGATPLLIAIALAFSSTVLAAKMLEDKRELGVFHGRTTIGILIMQDVIALIVLAVFAGKLPGPWALLILGTPLLRPLLYLLLDKAGHDEVLLLTGMLFSLVVGGAGFEAIGLKGEIGALVMGLLLSGHPKASELSHALWGLKEIFLVGFFLSIGMSGLPGWGDLGFALGLGLLLPVKGAVFFAVLIAFGLRARTAFLSAVSLTAYSEFGLIVIAGVPGAEAYLVPMALAVALSFLLAAPLNRLAHPLFDRLEPYLLRFERDARHPDDAVVDLGGSDVIVFGMGRTGSAAFASLAEAGFTPVGVDADQYKAEAHQTQGRNVVFADAEDSQFWKAVKIDQIKAAVLAMDDIEAKLIAASSLRARGFAGPIVSHAFFEDHAEQITAAGADRTYLTLQEAGLSLAVHTVEALEDSRA